MSITLGGHRWRALLLGAVALILMGCTVCGEYDVGHSARVPVGSSEETNIYTECGLRQSLFDLDGSLWRPLHPSAAEQAPPGIGVPTDEGTLTLVAQDRAEWRSKLGGVVPLVRREGSLTVCGC